MSSHVQTYAQYWLQDTLWPMTLRAAGYPLDTSLDYIQSLNLPEPSNQNEFPPYAVQDAQFYCSERSLFGACVLAQQLLPADSDQEMLKAIQALMWNQAIEQALARTLAFETNIEGFDNSEYEARFETSNQRWQAWIDTDDKVEKSLIDLLYAFNDAFLTSQTL